MRALYLVLATGLLLANACGASEDRVAAAYAAKRNLLLEKCSRVGIDGLPKRIYIRAFKEEQILEVWGYSTSLKQHVLVERYRIAALSGGPGPKRTEGDGQVPEGFYRIDLFNPKSQFLLSLRVNYPNASDRVLSDPSHPGGDIFIHGNQVSIGCLAMTDDKIREIYVLADIARQNPIPVHIFPARLNKANLARLSREHPEHAKLWRELEPALRLFERTHLVPKVTVRKDGSYVVAQ